MEHQRNDLAALLGSRICHDLISPLGAIANGLELLELSGVEGPELTLIRDSVNSANARVRLYRVAFGAASAGQTISAREVKAILGPAGAGQRVKLGWGASGDLPRDEVKLALLGVMCLETALPYGGDIAVSRDPGGRWTLEARAGRMALDEALWAHVSGCGKAGLPGAAQVHFALIGSELAAQGRTAGVALEEGLIRLSFQDRSSG